MGSVLDRPFYLTKGIMNEAVIRERVALVTGATRGIGRAVQPGEIADVIAFLAAPQAGYVPGAVIAADGGRTAI